MKPELQRQEIDSKALWDLKWWLHFFGTWVFQIPSLERKNKRKAEEAPDVDETKANYCFC